MSGAQLQLGVEVPAPAAAAEPTPEQRRAIDARDRDVLLEAGAGTGKTLVLVERFCAAAEDQGGVEGVLAFTFTERAAAELRHRIRVELGARSDAAKQGGDAERAELLAAMSRDSERAWISTIHGFCRRILSSHPVPLGLDPRFRVLDEPEADRIAARAFEDALDELLAGADPDAARLVAAIGIPALRDMARTAHDELRSLGHPDAELPQPRPADPAAAVAELARAARAALDEASGSGGRQANIDRLAGAATLDRDHPPGEAEIADLELNSAAAAFSGPACERYKEAWRAARRALVEHEAAHLYGHLTELVRAFGRRFAELKGERSGLDFEDLQLEALRLLRDHPGIAGVYRDRFRHVMVDEFQDTNEVQLALVRELSGPDTRVFAVGDEFQSIYGFRHADLRVFRRERERIGAEPPERAEVLPLSGNFRSRPEIVAAANFVGSALLDDYRPITVAKPPEKDRRVAPAVEMLLTPGGAGWKQEELGIRLPGDYPSPPDRVAEARLLAARLRELREGGVPAGDMVVLLRAFTHLAPFEEELERAGLAPYVVGGRGYWSQQQVDDLRRLIGVVANPLDDHCLLGALSSPACAVLPDTLWLLRQAAGKGRHLWPTIERHFGVGANPAEPDAGASEQGSQSSECERAGAEDSAGIDAIPDRDAERLREFCDTLAGLREAAPRIGLEELADRTMTRFGYDLATLLRPRGTRRLANARKLMRMARAYESAEGRDLRGFLASLDEAAGRSDREGEAATEAERHDGVRVMTVHAAKGLEFPVVAVADLGRRLLAPRRPSVRIDRPADDGDEPAPARVGVRLARFGAKSVPLYEYEQLIAESELDEAAESCRLAYVAATRAEDHLILSGCYSPHKVANPEANEEPAAGTPISERLLRALEIIEPEDEVVELPPPLPRPGLEARFDPARVAVRVNHPDRDSFRALSGANGNGTAPAPEPKGKPPLLTARARPEPPGGDLSYSALAAYGRCGYRFYAERILGISSLDRADRAAADGEATGARRRFAFGNAVHALLEWSARHGWRPPPGELCAELLRAEGLSTALERERAGQMVERWLDSELCTELRDGRASVRPEMPFLLPVGGSVVRGAIDLLADTPDGPLVVDYKTDSLADARPAELVDRYAVQRKIYALAAAGGTPPVRTAFAFLDDGGSPVVADFDREALDGARADLERLVAGVRGGRFEVTDSPHWALCRDCPARRHLCSHDTEATAGRLP
ncbi:MAG TPA: UvrD-helicase domain-containing protein [Solirubrobacterales bacterium]|nr:UvrD-helicase domain-containing protein [Solirubrobacterales bacterium]